MPGRHLRTSRGLLGSVLMVLGLGYAAIGGGWISTPTSQRLAGVEWLGVAGGDVVVGWAWVSVGAVMAVCGAFSIHRPAETAGTLIGFTWPLMVGGLFLVAWWTGESPNGWITTVSYAIYPAVLTTVASWPRPAEPLRAPRSFGSEGKDA